MKKTKTKTKKKSYYINKADELFSLYWRQQIGVCERCLKKEGLQVAHIISRGCKKLRYERDNTFVLCGGCHQFWAHKKPLEFAEFVKKKKGEDVYHYLIKSSNKLKPLGIDFYENKINHLSREMGKGKS